MLAFLGAKGGVGTTTLAVYLAIQLAHKQGKKVLLIDQKPQLGHVALYLGLKDTRYHFEELLLNAGRLDPELLEGYLVRHSSGLDVIASPELAARQHPVNASELVAVMEFLRREYDYIVLDCAAGTHEGRASIANHADDIYLVCTPDIAALRDLARLTSELALASSAVDKLRVVINRVSAEDSITPAQIAQAVELPVEATIPNNHREVVRAINDGEPISPLRRTEFNTTLVSWANRLAPGEHASRGSKRSLLSLLWSRV